ncbi:MAG: hypothetical protein COA78_20280 [Blastopirellula sp.]|nr:MAG: hypothetical protein COA78_20280 [Blastopirellula sp.]
MYSSLKPFVNDSKLWKSFLELLEDSIVSQQRTLEQTPDTVGVYRAQGGIEALRKMKRLRDMINGGSE